MVEARVSAAALRRGASTIAVAATLLGVAGDWAAEARAAAGDAPSSATRSCESLLAVPLPDPNAEVVAAAEHPASGRVPRSCRVEVVVARPAAQHQVRVWVWMPMHGWNRRFMGTGGGGFAGGSPASLPGPLVHGYAAGSTDTGHEGDDVSFALGPDGRLEWEKIRDYAYRGIHDMTVAGKALTRALYGSRPRYAYFNGCSTGGRQGLAEAQRYPEDYDGIVAGAPAINFAELHASQLWGAVVMQQTGNPVERCKLHAATKAAVESCDRIDGEQDGVLGDPRLCAFDPRSLVGTATPCGVVTEADARVIARLWSGPDLEQARWYGPEPGADLTSLAGTDVVDGELTPQPFIYPIGWYRYWLTQGPEWDWRTLTFAGFAERFQQSVEQYTAVIGTNDPDLRAFRSRGGKLVLWHGWSDQGIQPMGTVDYFTRVRRTLGARATDRFARLFMAPGVAHCGGGNGPQPFDAFGALVRWVEHGEAPERLATMATDAGDPRPGRPLCPFPKVARPRSSRPVADPDDYRCAKRYGG